MDNIQIKITNIGAIRAAFSRAPMLMSKELNVAIQKTVFTIGRRSRFKTPVDTGRLRSSTYERFSNLRGEVGTNTNYDRFIHDGTRYIQARPYLKNAVNESDSDIDEFFTKAVDNVLSKIGRAT